MKQNICVYGLSRKFTLETAKKLAEKFDMFFADVNALVQFDLQDVLRAEELCGKDYVKKIESKVLKNVCSFENTLFVCDYSLLNDELNFQVVNNTSYLMYLNLSKKKLKTILDGEKLRPTDLLLKLDMAGMRGKLCKKYADIVINCDSMNDDKILKDASKKLVGVVKNGNRRKNN